MNKDNDLSLLSPEEGKRRGLDPELIRSWNQLVLRERFPDTPVGFHSGAEKQEAVSAWKRQREEYRQRNEYVLRSSALPRCGFFVGRQAELSLIEGTLLGGNGQTKMVIHGMGGIGKTTLARQMAERLKSRYDKILWLSFRADLIHTICDDGQLEIKNLSWSGERCKNRNAYFKEKWQVLCRLLHRERVLLILDDMNGTKERQLSRLWELPCDVLVTSRTFRSAWQVAELALEPLQRKEDWSAFYATYSAEAVTRSRAEQLDAYRLTVQGNTLLMRLAVCNSELCAKTEGGNECYFLRTNALNSTDVQALRYLSLLPVDGIEVHRFLPAAGLKEQTLQKLTELSLVWVRRQNGGRSCGLHPVIAESVRRVYKPTPDNCSRFLSGLAAYYTDIWNRPYTEVLKAIPICFSLLRAWPKMRAWLADAYDALATVLWIGGYFEESLQYMIKLYEVCVEYYGQAHQMTGSIALRVGAVYHNSLRFGEAKQWYLTALELLQKSAPYNSEYHYRMMQAAFKVARAERHEGHARTAMNYLSVAEAEITQYRNTKAGRILFQKGEIWFVALEKAKTLAALGETDKAMALCKEIEMEYRREFPNRYHLLVELHIFRAELFLLQGNAPLALGLARECLERTKIMRGETAKETLGCEEVLADALCASGQAAEAAKVYHDLLCSLKQSYPLQKVWVQSVAGKEQASLREAAECK